MKFVFIMFAGLILFFSSCSLKPISEQSGSIVKTDNQQSSFEYPQLLKDEKLVKYTGFGLSYDVSKKVPRWTAYSLTAIQANTKSVKRKDKFMSDLKVDPNLSEKDYRGSGYDKGHMVPADDMRWSEKSMQDTFYMTNMAPQEHKLNAGIWRVLESKVKTWAEGYEVIYIVTGPVLTKPCIKMLVEKICVPAEFYKVILGKKNNEMKSIGFMIPHNFDKEKKLDYYARSIREVEKETGINFFPQLSSSESSQVETQKNVDVWLKF